MSRVLGAVGATRHAAAGGPSSSATSGASTATTSASDELDREVDQVFDSYARYWLESFRLPGTHPALIEDGMAVDGYEHIDDALDKGGGVILALPHLGGWEWAAFWLAESKGRTVTAVAEPVEPPELAEWFVGLRRDIGINVVPLGPSAGTECVRALKANDILCLLCDRDLAGGGVEVEFFGERTTLPGGPATLALRSGAPLLPTAVYFDGDRPPRPRAPAPAASSGRASSATTWPASPRTSPTSSSCSSAAHPTSGTSCNPTGPPTTKRCKRAGQRTPGGRSHPSTSRRPPERAVELRQVATMERMDRRVGRQRSDSLASRDATIRGVSDVDADSARLHAQGSSACGKGGVDRFEYSRSLSTLQAGEGQSTPVATFGETPGACQDGPPTFSGAIGGLTPNTTYYYRLCGPDDGESKWECTRGPVHNRLCAGPVAADHGRGRLASGGRRPVPHGRLQWPGRWRREHLCGRPHCAALR